MSLPDCCNKTNSDYNIIKPDSISQPQIFDNLKADVLSRDVSWRDWLESSTGQIIIRLLSGLGAYCRYSLEMSRLENSLEFARHMRSIVEHAFNRGLLLNPVNAAELRFKFMNEGSPVVIKRGDIIGALNKYDIISLDTKSIGADETEIRCIVGKLEVIDKYITNLKPFTEFVFFTQHKLVASQYEIFSTNGLEIEMRSDVNYLSSIYNDFVLRRTVPNEINIYLGNGLLGWYDKDATNFKYTCVSYDEDVNTHLKDQPTIYHNFKEISVERIPAETGLSEAEIKKIATYYPMDGRLVTDRDYEASIYKYFGGKLLDVHTYNSDPDEEIYLLVDDNYVDEDLNSIKSMVNNKRGLGIKVNYHVYSKDDGLEFSPKFKIKAVDYNTEIDNKILTYLNSLLFQFKKDNAVTITNTGLSVELTNFTCINIYPDGSQSINLDRYNFFKNINFSISTF